MILVALILSSSECFEHICSYENKISFSGYSLVFLGSEKYPYKVGLLSLHLYNLVRPEVFKS